MGRLGRVGTMLNLSTKGRYAARIMLALALAEGHRATKAEISRSEDISADYVEQILTKLRTVGLVRSHRGIRGGFSLARKPQEITVADVLLAAEGPLSIAPCLPDANCPRAGRCATRTLWQEASKALVKTFSGVTLADMAMRAERIGRSACPRKERTR
jgi:Rrf2 family protein